MAAGRCERTGDPLVPARAVRIRCDGRLVAMPQGADSLCSLRVLSILTLDRGRDASYLAPPAQIRASGIPARGSHLGYLTAKRTSGQG